MPSGVARAAQTTGTALASGQRVTARAPAAAPAPDGLPAGHPAGDPGHPIVVHVRDLGSGEMDIFAGTGQTRLRDRAIAAALARAVG